MSNNRGQTWEQGEPQDPAGHALTGEASNTDPGHSQPATDQHAFSVHPEYESEGEHTSQTGSDTATQGSGPARTNDPSSVQRAQVGVRSPTPSDSRGVSTVRKWLVSLPETQEEPQSGTPDAHSQGGTQAQAQAPSPPSLSNAFPRNIATPQRPRAFHSLNLQQQQQQQQRTMSTRSTGASALPADQQKLPDPHRATLTAAEADVIGAGPALRYHGVLVIKPDELGEVLSQESSDEEPPRRSDVRPGPRPGGPLSLASAAVLSSKPLSAVTLLPSPTSGIASSLRGMSLNKDEDQDANGHSNQA